MLLERSSTRDKWTIMMYMKDFHLMTTYAYALRSSNELNNDNIDEILLKMEEEGIYRPRSGGSTFTGQFKSIQIAWYMFGYYNKSRKRGEEKKMVFSPLGNLLLDNLKDVDKSKRIFLTMLWGNGFRQPFSQMDSRFNIYAYRLIFKLLRDSRLDGRLYNDEVFYLAMFLKSIDEIQYEKLVKEILNLRKMDPYEKYALYKANERVIGLACHEWRYGAGMLASAGIVDLYNDFGGRIIGALEYGNINPKTGKRNAIRHYREDYIVLSNDLEEYVDILLEAYPYYEKPFPEDELSTRFNNSIVVDMYSFYPPELLKELGMEQEEDAAISTMLQVANSVKYYSKEETAGGDKFEYALESAFNLFIDVEAERIAGAGNVDLECIYFDVDCNKKFDIEAKATRSKLVQINSRRLKKHREKIGSRYSIIVTPNYSLGVLSDIKGEESVIIKAGTLANYLYQYISKEGRAISYAKLEEIALNNFGKDITDVVDQYVYSNFGHAASDLSVKRNKADKGVEYAEMSMPSSRVADGQGGYRSNES